MCGLAASHHSNVYVSLQCETHIGEAHFRHKCFKFKHKTISIGCKQIIFETYFRGFASGVNRLILFKSMPIVSAAPPPSPFSGVEISIPFWRLHELIYYSNEMIEPSKSVCHVLEGDSNAQNACTANKVQTMRKGEKSLGCSEAQYSFHSNQYGENVPFVGTKNFWLLSNIVCIVQNGLNLTDLPSQRRSFSECFQISRNLSLPQFWCSRTKRRDMDVVWWISSFEMYGKRSASSFDHWLKLIENLAK